MEIRINNVITKKKIKDLKQFKFALCWEDDDYKIYCRQLNDILVIQNFSNDRQGICLMHRNEPKEDTTNFIGYLENFDIINTILK